MLKTIGMMKNRYWCSCSNWRSSMFDYIRL